MEEKKQADTVQPEEKKQENPTEGLITGGTSINLMPELSAQEIKVAEQKQTFDFRAVIFILFVAIISLGFVFYTSYIKSQYDQEQQKLQELENRLKAEANLMHNNNQVLNRYELFRYVQNNFFSSKEVLVFWQDVSEGLCEIRSIELSDGLEYEIQGVSDSLMNVAKFWHFLSIDSRVSEVHLESMNLPDVDSEIGLVRFVFSGELNINYFDQ